MHFIFIVIVLYDCSVQTSNAICGPVFSVLDIFILQIKVVVCFCCLGEFYLTYMTEERLYNKRKLVLEATLFLMKGFDILALAGITVSCSWVI